MSGFFVSVAYCNPNQSKKKSHFIINGFLYLLLTEIQINLRKEILLASHSKTIGSTPHKPIDITKAATSIAKTAVNLCI
ncbi:hypothetical protein TUM4445_41320 [Shewanella sp. MBTL60-112-B2]|nr:hypothetical protein TUM4444_41370 [Shewanella sp. MBTL60-112-B1]GIU41128.1 hypothetical protein TUM4445_41320 [Shewanella sp. MBTL60-112-B2]